MIVQYYYSVDGVETGPFGPALSPLVGGEEPVVGYITGLYCLDTLSNHSVECYLDYFKIGHTGYGSTEIFNDAFSGSGFTSWDRYLDGDGGVWLAETGGAARLLFTNQDIIQVTLEKWAHDLDHTDVYWTMDVKCPAATPAFATASMNVYAPDHVVLSFRPDSVAFAWAGVDSDTTAVDLDDGNWHTVGLRRERLGDDGPSVATAVSISHIFGLDT